MIFASFLNLNPLKSKFKLNNIYETHKFVYNLFSCKSNERTCLWSELSSDTILIISTTKPKDKLGHVKLNMVTHEVTKSFFEKGKFSFDITVNPTYRDAASRRTVPILDNQHVEQWFITKSSSLGFVVESMTVESMKTQIFTKHTNDTLTINMSKIKGTLTVTNVDTFMKTFVKGIGRSKAFGCGLIGIVPIQS